VEQIDLHGAIWDSISPGWNTDKHARPRQQRKLRMANLMGLAVRQLNTKRLEWLLSQSILDFLKSHSSSILAVSCCPIMLGAT